MIKLHQIEISPLCKWFGEEKGDIYIRASEIIAICRGTNSEGIDYTRVCVGKTSFVVEETPEEIIELLKALNISRSVF